MVYLVYGDQELLVNKMIDKLAKETLGELNDFNYVNLDATKIETNELEDELTTLSFFSDSKLVALTNSLFLLPDNKDCVLDYTVIKDYLDHETEGVTLVIGVVATKLDEKNTLVKKLKTCAKLIEVNTLTKKDLPRIVKQMFEKRGAEITDSALEEFLKRVDMDMYSITNEVEKLTTYSSKIHADDIKALTPRKIEDNIFDLIDAMFKKNASKSFAIYNDLKGLGNEPVNIIAIIASQTRFLYQVAYLSNKGYSEQNIANELSVHPFRVKMGLEKVRHYEPYELEDFLDKLSKLDVEIKVGNIDRFIGLELFILQMTN